MVYTRSMKKKSLEAKAEDNQTWLNLPFDLTLLIMKRLSLKDNIRASAVCKTWQKALVSVRVEDTTPWVMFFLTFMDSYVLYDPSLGETHIVKLKSLEVRCSEIRCAKDGWLLMHDKDLTGSFFFNPFTHERIEVVWPTLWSSDAVAFSCAPTSSSCVLVSVEDFSNVFLNIQTYSPTTKKRTSLSVLQQQLPFAHKGCEHAVFSNGVFYFLTKMGYLGMFDLSTMSWNVLCGQVPKHLGASIDDQCYMTEYQGDVYLVYTHGLNRKPTCLKLDLTNRKWTVKERLPGLTFYLGFESLVTTDRDLVENPKQNQYTWWTSVWINPPTNVSSLFKT